MRVRVSPKANLATTLAKLKSCLKTQQSPFTKPDAQNKAATEVPFLLVTSCLKTRSLLQMTIYLRKKCVHYSQQRLFSTDSKQQRQHQTKGEFLTLLPLNERTWGEDIYKFTSSPFMVTITTDGAMCGVYKGFIAHHHNDSDFPSFMNDHFVIHQ